MEAVLRLIQFALTSLAKLLVIRFGLVIFRFGAKVLLPLGDLALERFDLLLYPRSLRRAVAGLGLLLQ